LGSSLGQFAEILFAEQWSQAILRPMKNEDKLNFTLTIVAAILGALAIPSEIEREGIVLFGFISHIPLIIVMARVKNIRKLILHVLVYTVIHIPIQLYWLSFFKDYSIYTVGGVVVGMIGYFSLWFPIMWFVLKSSPRAYRFLLFGAVWTVYEYWKSFGFLGFPWGLISYPLYHHLILFQTAEWFGIYFLTFLLASSQAWIADWFLPDRGAFEWQKKPLWQDSRSQLWQSGAVLGGFWLFNILFGLITYYDQKPTDAMAQLDVVLVQQNVDSYSETQRVRAMVKSVGLTQQQIPDPLDPPDLVVWSEQSLYYPFDSLGVWRSRYQQTFAQMEEQNQIGLRSAYEAERQKGAVFGPLPSFSLLDFVSRYDTDYVFGVRFDDYGPENIRVWDRENDIPSIHNSTVVLNQEARLQGYYPKHQMVPFVENVPLYYSSSLFRAIYNAIGLYGSYSDGKGLRLFQIQSKDGTPLQYGTPICFEDAFTWVTQDMTLLGADFHVNLTNNSWSMTDSAQDQHFLAAFLRTIETRRPLIRASNSGMTGIIDAKGNVTLGPLPYFTADSARTTIWIDPHAPITGYTRWGDLLVMVLALFGLLPAINYWYWRYKKQTVSLV
jgi:apolipoprotein N-acyltransferase